MADNPELFWLNKKLYTSYVTGSKLVVTLFYTDGTVSKSLKKTADRSLINQQILAFAKAAQKITSAIDSGMTQSEKEKALFLAVIGNTAYDYTYYNGDKTHVYTSTAYGALVDKTAICSGYSYLFQYLCYETGINCTQVIGSNHEWNLVQTNGKWYHVDTTYADTKTIGWKYFNATDSQITADRSIETKGLPQSK